MLPLRFGLNERIAGLFSWSSGDVKNFGNGQPGDRRQAFAARFGRVGQVLHPGEGRCDKDVAAFLVQPVHPVFQAPALVDARFLVTQTVPPRAKLEMRTARSTASPSTVSSCDPGRKVPCHSCPSSMPVFM